MRPNPGHGYLPRNRRRQHSSHSPPGRREHDQQGHVFLDFKKTVIACSPDVKNGALFDQHLLAIDTNSGAPAQDVVNLVVVMGALHIPRSRRQTVDPQAHRGRLEEFAVDRSSRPGLLGEQLVYFKNSPAIGWFSHSDSVLAAWIFAEPQVSPSRATL